MITLCMLGNFFHAVVVFCRLFFKIYFFKILFQENYQCVNFLDLDIRTKVLSVLISAQTVCKDSQQPTKARKEIKTGHF